MSNDGITLPDNCAWHYTSASGLQGIVAASALRATSAAFMNDANEMKTGVQALMRSYERLKDELPRDDTALVEESGLFSEASVFNSFLVSASKEPDLLTLWRNYGGGQVAYSIAFDRAAQLVPREQVAGDSHPSPPTNYGSDAYEEVDGVLIRLYDPDQHFVLGGTWREVDYVPSVGTAEHEQRIRDFISSRRRSLAKGGLIANVGHIADSPVNLEKDDGFADEREVRIIVDLNPAWKFVKFRESRFGLIPYIELTASSGDEFATVGADGRLPIRHVRIGPSPDPEHALRSLSLFLENHGYGDVPVSASTIPYR